MSVHDRSRSWRVCALLVAGIMALQTFGLELFVGWSIRDNLTLNLIMLVHPFDAIKTWQAAG